MKKGIYQIKNEVNGKRYIGRSSNVKQRWSSHKSQLRGGYQDNDHFQNAWNKYGEENFTFELIHEIEDEEDRIEKEQKYFDAYLSANIWDQLYNIEKDASESGPPMKGEDHPFYGKERSEETKEKIRENAHVMTGQDNPMKDPEVANKLGRANKGKEIPESTKEEISETLTGRTLSKEHKIACSKLSEEEIKELRYRYNESDEDVSQSDLSEEYGVSSSQISNIVNYKILDFSE